MKRVVKIMMITLVLAVAVNSVMNAQRGMRGNMPDSAWKGRQGDYMIMHRGYPGFAGCPCMVWGPPGRGFRGGYGPGRFDRPSVAPLPPAGRRFESIPNLTEKQKKDIADLRQKHLDEMQKFREGNLAKAKEMRESHQKKVLDLLTDEQKKYLEGTTQIPPPVKK